MKKITWDMIKNMSDDELLSLPPMAGGDPATAGMAIVGGQIVGGFLSANGAKKQAKALREAGNVQEAIKMEQLAMYRQLLEEGRPLREAYQEAALANLPLQQAAYQQSLGLLSQDILREPGTGALFNRGLSRGKSAIAKDLSKYGIDPSSGVAQRGFAELTGSLLASDIANIRNARFNLLDRSNFAKPANTLSTAVNLLSGAGNVAANRADLIASEGAVKGGLYGSIGQDVANIGLLAGLGVFNKPVPQSTKNIPPVYFNPFA